MINLSLFLILGAMDTVRLTVITELVGVERVSNAFGLYVTVCGFSVIFGSPLTGKICN